MFRKLMMWATNAVVLLNLLNCRRVAKTSFLAIHGNCDAG